MATENMNQQSQAAAAEESIDISDLLLMFLANWRWFVLSIIICLIAALFYIAKQVPVYQINASIYLRQDQNSSQNTFNLSEAADPMVAFKNYIDETELEVLKSRNNLVKIVDSLGLMYRYSLKGTFRDVPLYRNQPVTAHMSREQLDALKGRILLTVKGNGTDKYDIDINYETGAGKEEAELKDVTLPTVVKLSAGEVALSINPALEGIEDAEPLDGTEYIDIVSSKNAAAGVAGGLNIEFAKNSEKIIRVSYSTPLPAIGVDLINVLLDFYNRDIIEDKNRSAVQTEAFIIDRLMMINGELKDVEDRLQAYRQAHSITDIQAQSTLSLSLKSNYEKEIAKIDAQEAIYAEIERIISQSDLYTPLPALIDDPNISRTIDEYNRKLVRLNRALDGSTPDNPLVLSVKEEITRDKENILRSLETSKRALLQNRQSLSRLENASAGQLASTPAVDKGFQEIFREQQVKVNIYTFLLQRREEIALQKTLATNTARLIDDPIAEGPISPRRMMILAMAFILGAGIPALFLFLRRTVFPRFSDKDELSKLTTVPVIGEICHVPQSDICSNGLAVAKGANSAASELFRLLRSNISFTKAGRDGRVILVTSTVSGEGKTFISANLAMTYVLMGKRVAVVGLDLRRPMLAHSFGLSNRSGVTTFLSGQETDLHKLLVQSKLNPDLYVLPAGPVPPSPNELLLSDNMGKMISELRYEFDYVIIDSAPVGVISDTFLITRHTDMQLFVARANYSTKKSLSVLHESVASGKFPSVYIVLNGVNITSNSYLYRRYGYYSSSSKNRKAYGYGYSNSQTTADEGDASKK